MTTTTPIPGTDPATADEIALLRSHLSELASAAFKLGSLLEGLDPLNEAAGVPENPGIISRRAQNARSVLTEDLIGRVWELQERAELAAKDRPQ